MADKPDNLDNMDVYDRLNAVSNATMGCEMVARKHYCEALKYIARLRREAQECVGKAGVRGGTREFTQLRCFGCGRTERRGHDKDCLAIGATGEVFMDIAEPDDEKIERLEAELATAKDQGEDAYSSGFDSLEHDIAKVLGCEEEPCDVVEKVRWLVEKRVPALEGDVERLGKLVNYNHEACQKTEREREEACAEIEQLKEDNPLGTVLDIESGMVRNAARIEELEKKVGNEVALCAEIDRLKAELNKRKGDPVTRLHNICEGISRDADGSEWSREEWERIDKENTELRIKLKRFAAQIIATGKAAARDHACAQCYPDGDVLVDGFICVVHQAITYCDHEFADTKQCVKCGWEPND